MALGQRIFAKSDFSPMLVLVGSLIVGFIEKFHGRVNLFHEREKEFCFLMEYGVINIYYTRLNYLLGHRFVISYTKCSTKTVKAKFLI